MIESHLAKYRSLLPSLALLIHLVDVVDGRDAGPVSIQAVRMAAAWCDYLEAHARRIYHLGLEEDTEPALALAQKIKTGKLSSPFTSRDVYRNGWSGLSTEMEVGRAVGVLEQRGWVIRVETPTKGRPRTDIYIHPGLLAPAREVA